MKPDTTVNVLFIAYQFPPRSGAGVHRSINFVKHLRQYGYNPIVFTIDEKSIRSETSQVDHALMDQLPPDLVVVRTPSYSIGPAARFLQKIRLHWIFWNFIPPFCWEWSTSWAFLGFWKARKTIKQHNIKLVYTTSGPFSPMFLGFFLQRLCGVKWVADLRDPYTDAYMWKFPNKIHWRIARLVERYLFKKPDALIVNTEEVRKLYIQRGICIPENIITLTSGF